MLKKKLGIEGIERRLVRYYYKIPSTLVIPGDCKKIGKSAFYSCESADVLIMTSERKFRSLGRLALNDCLTVSYVKEETRN